MFASQTPRLGQLSRAIFRPRGQVNPAARWLVAFVVFLFLLLTPGLSHACANGPASNAPQRVVASATTRAIAPTYAAGFTSNRSGCCGEQSRHCGGAQTGSCCPACTVGLFVSGYTFIRAVLPRADFSLLKTSFSPAPLDEQFRPPRTTL